MEKFLHFKFISRPSLNLNFTTQKFKLYRTFVNPYHFHIVLFYLFTEYCLRIVIDDLVVGSTIRNINTYFIFRNEVFVDEFVKVLIHSIRSNREKTLFIEAASLHISTSCELSKLPHLQNKSYYSTVNAKHVRREVKQNVRLFKCRQAQEQLFVVCDIQNVTWKFHWGVQLIFSTTFLANLDTILEESVKRSQYLASECHIKTNRCSKSTHFLLWEKFLPLVISILASVGISRATNLSIHLIDFRSYNNFGKGQ